MAVRNSTGRKAKSHAPAKAQSVVPSNDCPIDVEGPAHERINIAHEATHQARSILQEALNAFAVAERDEGNHVHHALISRAYMLAKAASVLLGADEEIEIIEHSKGEVLRGY